MTRPDSVEERGSRGERLGAASEVIARAVCEWAGEHKWDALTDREKATYGVRAVPVITALGLPALLDEVEHLRAEQERHLDPNEPGTLAATLIDLTNQRAENEQLRAELEDAEAAGEGIAVVVRCLVGAAPRPDDVQERLTRWNQWRNAQHPSGEPQAAAAPNQPDAPEGEGQPT